MRLASGVAGLRLVGAVLSGGLLAAGPGCGEKAERKPPPHECLEDSACKDGRVCINFRCLDPNAGTGGEGGDGGEPGGGSGGTGSGGRASSGGSGGRASSGGAGDRASSDGAAGDPAATSDNVSLKTYPIHATGVVGRGSIYAVVASDDPEYANSLIKIDPLQKKVVSAVEVGSNPGSLAAAGAVLWVGLDGEHAVRSIDIASAEPVLGDPIPLPTDDAGNPTTAGAMVGLGLGTVLVSLRSEGRYFGTTILGKDTPATVTFPGPKGPSILTNGRHIYGTDNDGTDAVLYDLGERGGSLTEFEGLLGPSPGALTYAGGLLYTSSGRVVSIDEDSTPSVGKALPYPGLVVPDVDLQNLYILVGSEDGTAGTQFRSVAFGAAAAHWTASLPSWKPSSLRQLIRASLLVFAFIDDDLGVLQQITILK